MIEHVYKHNKFLPFAFLLIVFTSLFFLILLKIFEIRLFRFVGHFIARNLYLSSYNTKYCVPKYKYILEVSRKEKSLYFLYDLKIKNKYVLDHI